MEISDLVPIGKLDKAEADGFFCIRFHRLYQSVATRLTECFLIFDSDRVFFVSVVESKIKGKRTYLRFREDGIAEECNKHAKIIVALAPEDLADLQMPEQTENLIGYSVWFKNEEIGILEASLKGTMQSVFSVKLHDGRELLVPNVSYYVSLIDNEAKQIILKNAEQLLEICT